MGTKIQWTDESWNPIIGCEKISPGCKKCYAEKMAYRLACMEMGTSGEENYSRVINWETKKWYGKTHFQESQLNKPLKRKKPTMYFVCSMGDLFHESVPFEWVMRVYDIIAQCPQHTFQILTKRPDRMKQFFEWLGNEIKNAGLDSDPTGSKHPFDYFESLPNLWLGTTIENQDQIERARILLEIPAQIHFVSVEPMLSRVDFSEYFFQDKDGNYLFKGVPERDRSKLINLLDWIICGGESGHNARPIHPDWVRDLKNQCETANVPFFFKQWGEWGSMWVDMTNSKPTFKMYVSYLQFTQKLWVNKGDACIDMDGKILKNGGDFQKASYPVCIMQKTGKKNAGCLIDGKEYKQFPKK